MIGRLTGFSLNRDGTQNVTITVASPFADKFDELKDFDVSVEIKKARNIRSLPANAYAWVLIDQIAAKTGRKVTDIYREEIRELGDVSEMFGMKDEVVPVFKRIWETGHLGRQVEVVPGSKKDGWSNVKVYFGSSEFDSEQMHRFISNLIQDAEALGIPTITPAEEMKMLGRYKVQKQKDNP